MKWSGFTLILLCMSQLVMSQENGSVSIEMLAKFREETAKSPEIQAKINAASNNELKKIVLNRQNAGTTDHFFKYKVDVSGITDQKNSGRCWMFTGLNMFRPKVIQKLSIASFEFSTVYLYFYDLLEKSNLFLEAVQQTGKLAAEEKIVEWLFKNPIGDGGVWSGLPGLISKYGLVPKSVMPETFSSESTGALQQVLGTKLREFGLEIREMVVSGTSVAKIRERKNAMLSDIYKILVIHLGQPPVKFQWRYSDKSGTVSELKEYTPLTFKNEFLGDVQFGDYLQFMNDPTRPYYKTYEIEFDRNMADGVNWVYLNLPMDDIRAIAKESIKNNEALYFSCDVGKQLNKETGVLSLENYDYEALYGIPFKMDKKARIQTFESGSSHGMALVAVDVDANDKPVKWQVENSWGSSSGYNGYLTITDEWFGEYMFRLVALKKFVKPEIIKMFEIKPVKLPPWDPMFRQDE